ncbi:hypothetical protein PFWH6_4214 [Pseudomonas fluorescens WH6]|nr:hypothetical protein PFWH6_4214 [Pseudomonas fluorescens WH6]
MATHRAGSMLFSSVRLFVGAVLRCLFKSQLYLKAN